MNLTCLACGAGYEVAEGTDLQEKSCPKCGTPQGSIFTYAKTLRFEAVDQPAYAQACDLMREGDAEGALAALEEAFRGGFDDFEPAENDPGLAPLRKDARFGTLVDKYRNR